MFAFICMSLCGMDQKFGVVNTLRVALNTGLGGLGSKCISYTAHVQTQSNRACTVFIFVLFCGFQSPSVHLLYWNKNQNELRETSIFLYMFDRSVTIYNASWLFTTAIFWHSNPLHDNLPQQVSGRVTRSMTIYHSRHLLQWPDPWQFTTADLWYSNLLHDNLPQQASGTVTRSMTIYQNMPLKQ
jgi:hypothetical protein